ncbi:MAG: lipid A deacylase LpxR family protein [Ferruginibacter sp.]|nr:lipid A deacylase LpxR family protein [Ferruginibacter sp.]
MQTGYTLTIFSLLIFSWIRLTAQSGEVGPNYLLRFYEDNDRYNLLSKTTDYAYTNGTQINFYYTRENPSKFIVDQIMPGAGDQSINVLGWGLTQLMFTPADITTSAYQADDYPYAGALFITRSVYSYNPFKKYDVQTELSLGVRGPAALAEEMQRFIHRFVGIPRAMGWYHQLSNKLYANLNIKAEKGLAAIGKLEVIAGGQLFAGTMVNAVGLSSKIRFGIMAPYFNGFLTGYKAVLKTANKKDIQIYLVVKPEIVYTFHDGLLTGEVNTAGGTKTKYRHNPSKFNYALSGGVVIVYKKLGLSVSQNSSCVFLPGLYNHNAGNFSLYLSW